MPDLERIAAAVISQVRARLELIALEWQEEKLRLGRSLIWLAMALFFAQLAIVLAVLWIVVLAWDGDYRTVAIALSTFAAIVGAAVCARSYLQNRNTRALGATVAEMKKDQETLERSVGPTP